MANVIAQDQRSYIEVGQENTTPIDLYYEVPSERSVFKTQMTAVGCSLLVLTLLATVVYLIVATMFDLNATVKHVARVLIFLPLVVFLAMQVLLFLTKPSSP